MVKINDVKELKFAVDGVDVEKSCKVYSISGEDKVKNIRFFENEAFKMESQLDDQGRVLEDKATENGVSSVTKYEYTDDGKVYEKRLDCDGNVICERVTVKENGREVTTDNNGNETVVEVFEKDGGKVRKITRSKDGEVYETVERHLNADNKPVYSKTDRKGKPVIESWSEFDEDGYCARQKVVEGSDVTEYRNVKYDDGKLVVLYVKSGENPEEVLGITELVRSEEMVSEIHYHIV